MAVGVRTQRMPSRARLSKPSWLNERHTEPSGLLRERGTPSPDNPSVCTSFALPETAKAAVARRSFTRAAALRP